MAVLQNHTKPSETKQKPYASFLSLRDRKGRSLNKYEKFLKSFSTKPADEVATTVK